MTTYGVQMDLRWTGREAEVNRKWAGSVMVYDLRDACFESQNGLDLVTIILYKHLLRSIASKKYTSFTSFSPCFGKP